MVVVDGDINIASGMNGVGWQLFSGIAFRKPSKTDTLGIDHLRGSFRRLF